MTICDRCRSMEAKTLRVHTRVVCTVNFDGSSVQQESDLCRACFDKLRAYVQGTAVPTFVESCLGPK